MVGRSSVISIFISKHTECFYCTTGHTFQAYARDLDPAVQIERARDADVLRLANMPLSGEVIRACDGEGYGHITLCPETMGKINQLGDLEEVLTLCTEAEGLLPCVDFGHLYARSLGALDGPEAVERMLDQMVRELGVARASQFHSHFSKIAYTPRGGEARHLTFDQPDFGPDPAPLCEALARRGWSPRVICESAGTQDVDALWMKGAYLRALGETAEG